MSRLRYCRPCIGIGDLATGSDYEHIERDAEGRPTGLLYEQVDVMDSLSAANVDETAEYISDAIQVRDGSTFHCPIHAQKVVRWRNG